MQYAAYECLLAHHCHLCYNPHVLVDMLLPHPSSPCMLQMFGDMLGLAEAKAEVDARRSKGAGGRPASQGQSQTRSVRAAECKGQREAAHPGAHLQTRRTTKCSSSSCDATGTPSHCLKAQAPLWCHLLRAGQGLYSRLIQYCHSLISIKSVVQMGKELTAAAKAEEEQKLKRAAEARRLEKEEEARARAKIQAKLDEDRRAPA